MATIHMSEAEAALDFAGLLDRVRAGTEVVIEKKSVPAILLRATAVPRGRLLSESIALAHAHARDVQNGPSMDAEFASDLKDIIAKRSPRQTAVWE